MRTIRIAASIALLIAAIAPPATAQRRSERPVPGWIGISVEVMGDRWGRAVEVIITEISEGSPAEDAGLRPGDRLLAINDLNTIRELSELSERLRLEAGDRVALEVQRDDQRYRIRVRAEERPVEYVVGENREVSFQADSMVETWARAMDSLRIHIIEDRGRNIRITGAPRPTEARVTMVPGAAPGAARGNPLYRLSWLW